MIKKVGMLLRRHIFLVLIIIGLFWLPFTWIKPGEMDIGGDSTRLYLYDPVNFLKSFGLYGVDPQGTGWVGPNHYIVPFAFLVMLVKVIFPSPHIAINLLAAVKLVCGFWFVVLIVKELANEKARRGSAAGELAAIIAGIFYIFTPSVIGNWSRAILSTNQVFLNPLMFYLLLRYFLTSQTKYGLVALLISFMFAPNFGLTGAPPFFAFYPLGFLFLVLYTTLVRHRPVPWRGLIAGGLMFVGLHAFHLLPQFVGLFDPGSFVNTRVFDAKSMWVEGINYFMSVLPNAKVSWFLLLPSYNPIMTWSGIVVPFIVLVGLWLNKNTKGKTMVLVAAFYVITLFLVAANITHFWVAVYRILFFIPGFSMFRNFFGQWQFVYSFYYALFFGLALYLIFLRCKPVFRRLCFLFLCTLFIVSAWPFIHGDLVNPRQTDTEADVHIVMRMDPRYEDLLNYVRSLKGDGKILTLPFVDAFYQVLHGTNNGAYIGPSTISYLARRNDFAAYAIMDPFPEVFFRLAQEENYVALKRLFAILNIKYIFHNTDPLVYDETFPRFPYSYVRKFLPKTQKEMEKFVGKLGVHLVYENGPYKLYALPDSEFLPHIYASSNVLFYENDRDDWYGKNVSFFVDHPTADLRTGFIEKKDAVPRAGLTTPAITFQKINPTKYRVTVEDVRGPYLLVFSERFNRNWKIFRDDSKSISSEIERYFDAAVRVKEQRDIFFDSDTIRTWTKSAVADKMHVVVNGFANGWYILPEDTGAREQYNFVIEMTGQRYFYIGLVISAFTLGAIGLFFIL